MLSLNTPAKLGNECLVQVGMLREGSHLRIGLKKENLIHEPQLRDEVAPLSVEPSSSTFFAYFL